MVEVVCAILLAVILDRFVPEHWRADPFVWLGALAESVAHRFDGGSRSYGTLALVGVVVAVLLLVLVLHYLLGALGWIPQFVFAVLVLFWCVGLHRLGEQAGEVIDALQTNEISIANENLRAFSGYPSDDLSESGIAHDAVETVLKQGNTNVIAPLFWFVLLGPLGAVLQRVAGVLTRFWGNNLEDSAGFGWAAQRLADVLAWLPARITALSYAAMGSFEDAVRCWRVEGDTWSDSADAPLLAAGLGAMQLKNCEDPVQDENSEARAAVTVDSTHVQRALALVWRALLFWLTLTVLMLAFGVLVR